MLVPIKECGRGVNKDLLPSELLPGQWSDALNMRFPNGFAKKRKGITAAYTTPAVIPYWLGTYSTTASRFLVEAGLAKVYVDDGTTQTEITGTAPTGAIDDRWSGGVLGGVLIMNNGVDSPSYWNGDVLTNLTTLAGWTAGWKSDVIRPFKNFLVALGNTRGGSKMPHNVGWSNSAEPGAIPTQWTASTTNDAGDVDLAETTGEMVDCMPLGDVNIIYKQDARYAQQYIGGNDVFSFRRLPGNDGLLARGCIANTPKGQVFLSNGDVKIHSGGEAQSIAEGRIRRWLFSSMDSSNANRSFLVTNPQTNEVWVCFPSTGSATCDTVAAWNWESDTWGIFSVSAVTYGSTGLIPAGLANDTWASDSAAWTADTSTWAENEYSENESRLILATSTPQIGLAETGALDFGSAVTWRLEKVGISLDDSDRLKVFNASRPQVDAFPGTAITVYHGSSMSADGAVTYAASTTFTVGTSNWANRYARAGRYAAFKMESSASFALSLRSWDMKFEPQGLY